MRRILKTLDSYKEGSDYDSPGLVAIYPIVGGMDIACFGRHTGVPLTEAVEYARRLRENGVWTEDSKVSVTFGPDDIDR